MLLQEECIMKTRTKTRTIPKTPFFAAFSVGAVLFSNQTGPLGQTETAEKLLQKWKES